MFGTKDAFRNFYLNPAPVDRIRRGVKWDPEEEPDSFISEGKLTVRLKRFGEQRVGMFVFLERPTRPSDHVVNRDEYGFRSTSNDRWGVGLPYDIPTVLCLRGHLQGVLSAHQLGFVAI